MRRETMKGSETNFDADKQGTSKNCDTGLATKLCLKSREL